MEQKKWRVVCYINQFFGQIGGEEMAHVGFSVKHEAVGPARLFQELLRERCEVVGTVICGDNYFAEDTERGAAEGLALVRALKPDLFIAPLTPGVTASAVAAWLRRWPASFISPRSPACSRRTPPSSFTARIPTS